ncbi:hypothetical protein [Dysgonomonas sp. 25]|uniref:hypothetical protein n=1 Tax=Dysgonomonas sp. 25 TaxID=2302933 RepID=UPI0013D037A2|nr:hypothetical protein [Dysgonomonas sp. 25]NDV69608.1 hypothetical protein [Dysgonomonas sp. 25]
MILKSLLIWVCIIPLAIVNGIMREQVLSPIIGESYSLPLSGILLSLFIFLLSYFTIKWVGVRNAASCRLIGIIWLLLTILFEFGFGILALNKSFTALLDAYDPTTGNLWILVVAVTFFAPRLAAKARKII